MGKRSRRKGRRRRRAKPRVDRSVWTEDPRDELLSRFIKDKKGRKLGESIGVEGNEMIMKRGDRFYIIPLKNIKKKKKELLFVGKINWKAAKIKGERWRKRSLDVIKVTTKLRTQ